MSRRAFTPGLTSGRPVIRLLPTRHNEPVPANIEAVLARVAAGTTTAADADTLRSYIHTLRGA